MLNNKFFEQGMFSIDPNSTPEQLERRRQKVAQMMANPGSKSIAEGAIKLAGGVIGGIQSRNANKLEREKRGEATELFDQILGARKSQPMPGTSPILGALPSAVETGDIPDTPEAVAADTRSALGFDSAMPESLIGTESGGNFNALNNEVGAGGVRGHGGRGQFGHARLQDAAKAGIIPAGTTPQQFSQMPPETQVAVENWHFADIDKAIEQNGLSDLIGQQIGGVTVTRDGLRAVAHLGGVGGMKRFAESGGAYNPSDSFGTSLMDYLGTHQGSSAAPSASYDDTADLQAALANPWMTAEQKATIAGMLDQRRMENDPLRQLQIQKAQVDLEGARNPAPQGPLSSLGKFHADQAAGLIPPDAQPPQSGVNVTVGGEGTPTMGTIPQGYAAVEDSSDPSGYRLVPIPGGPEDTTQSDSEKAAAAETASEVVTNAFVRASGADGQRAVSGLLGQIASMNPSSNNAEVYRQVAVLQDLAAAESLNAMRRQSPTGGALGNVTERELALLSRQAGALDPASPNFQRDLQDYTRALMRTIHGGEAGDSFMQEILKSSEPQADDDGWTTMPNGVRIRKVD